MICYKTSIYTIERILIATYKFLLLWSYGQSANGGDILTLGQFVHDVVQLVMSSPCHRPGMGSVEATDHVFQLDMLRQTGRDMLHQKNYWRW